MGGCRCSYTSCKKSTDGVTHFFHFPVKDQYRCHIWIHNCRRPDLGKLTMSQLKNKVICQNHFEDRMFLNYKHDRLIHNAVPTIEFYDSKQDTQRFQSQPDDNEIKDEVKYQPVVQNTEKSPDSPKKVLRVVKKHHSTPFSPSKGRMNLRNTSLSSVDDSTIVYNKDNSTLINETITEKENDTTSKVNAENEKQGKANASIDLPTQLDVANVTTQIPSSFYCNSNKDIETVLQSVEPNKKKMVIIHSVVNLPEDKRINIADLKGRSLLKVNNGRISKPNILRSAKSPAKVDKVVDNILSSLPSETKNEGIISQTPKIKKPSAYVALIDEQLRRFNRNRGVVKKRFCKSNSPRVLEESPPTKKTVEPKDDSNDYMKLILKTQEEMMEIKKMLQRNTLSSLPPTPVVEQTALPKLSKEYLYAAIVPYLSPELAKKVHLEMFPSLAVNVQLLRQSVEGNVCT